MFVSLKVKKGWVAELSLRLVNLSLIEKWCWRLITRERRSGKIPLEPCMLFQWDRRGGRALGLRGVLN